MPGAIDKPITPIAPLRAKRFSLERAVNRIPLNRVGNTTIPDSARPQMAKVSGVHQRSAHGHVMSITHDIMSAARENLSRSDLKAMNRTLELLGPDTAEHFGNMLLMHLTALGAMHASISNRLQDTPNDATLIRCKQRIEDSIVTIGIKAGRCKTVADGGYHGDKRSLKLTDAMKVARQRMVECASNGKGVELLEGIAAAVLPGPLMDSISERQQNPGAFVNGDRSVSPMQVLQKKLCDDLEKVLQAHLDIGGAENLIVAVLDLLKLPEYVLQGDPGRTGDVPDAPVRDNGPGIPPELLRSGYGAPVLYNNNQAAPITIKNDASHTFSPTDIRNLVNDSFDRGYSLGLSHGESVQLRAENTALLKQCADLLELLRKDNQRLNLFAKGPDLVRVPAGASEDEVDSTVQKQDTPPPSDDRNPQFALDPDSPRAPRVPDVNRQQSQLNRQDNLSRQDNDQRSDQQLNRADNGTGGPRNPKRENDADSQNRLGGTQQLDQRQRDEQNRYLQQDDGSNRSGGLGGDGSGTHYAEFKGFLQAAEYEERIEPRDKFEPPTERRKDPNVVKASHVAKYVKERSARAGTPFVPSMKGPLLPPVHSSPGRVRELIQELGAARFVPSKIAEEEGTVGLKKSAPATLPAKSPLQVGMEAFFQKRDLALLELAQSRPSVQAQPASAVLGGRTTFQSFLDTSPSSPIAVRGVLNRSDSRASIASNESDASETGAELGKRIYSASRQSRATLPPRAGHGPLNAPAAGLTPLAQLARSIPSAPIVETAVRPHAASPASPGLANGQRQDVLRQNIVADARTPRGEKERSVSFSVPRDPQESADPYGVYEFLRDEEPPQNDVTPGQQYKSFDEEWEALSSSSTSSASSVAGDGPEELVDFGDFEPERDNMVVQRSYSAVSMDSGRDSPPVLSADESGEPKTPLRVADRVAVNPKGIDLADQHVQLIKELSERLKRVKETEE